MTQPSPINTIRFHKLDETCVYRTTIIFLVNENINDNDSAYWAVDQIDKQFPES
jgi:hypothetical protein